MHAHAHTSINQPACTPPAKITLSLYAIMYYMYIVSSRAFQPTGVRIKFCSVSDIPIYSILCKIYLAIFLCFASLFAHLSSILNNFNYNDENWILGK